MEVGIIFVLDVFDYAQVPDEQNGQRTTPNEAEEFAGFRFLAYLPYVLLYASLILFANCPIVHVPGDSHVTGIFLVRDEGTAEVRCCAARYTSSGMTVTVTLILTIGPV